MAKQVLPLRPPDGADTSDRYWTYSRCQETKGTGEHHFLDRPLCW